MKRYFGIEILRFFTSIAVLIYHYRLFFLPYNHSSNIDFFNNISLLPYSNFLSIFYEFGIYGVHLFYTISGFVFAHIYLSTKKNVTAKDFFVNRFARLYPLHFATLILVTLMQYFSLFTLDTFQVEKINDFYHFMLHIFFISSWGFESGHSFNSPIWSVSVEIAIYIIFFIFLFVLKKFKLTFVILLAIFLLVFEKLNIMSNLFVECARLFFSGVLIYYICKIDKYNKLTIFVSLALILVSFIGNYKTYLFCPAILMFFVLIDNFIDNKAVQKIFTKLGSLTYAIYLLHFPIIILVLIIFELFDLNNKLFLTNYFLITLFSIVIISANYCFNFFEKPLNIKIRSKLNR